MLELEPYEIVKILHIISVISWMAGLLYLPRIFVYHAQINEKSDANQIFQTMERKLLYFIMTPAMILTFLFGFYLASEIGFSFVWIQIKITLVLFLAGYQGFLSKCYKNFAKNQNKYSHKFYRIINEIPTILMIIIVSLVILKPF